MTLKASLSKHFHARTFSLIANQYCMKHFFDVDWFLNSYDNHLLSATTLHRRNDCKAILLLNSKLNRQNVLYYFKRRTRDSWGVYSFMHVCKFAPDLRASSDVCGADPTGTTNIPSPFPPSF